VLWSDHGFHQGEKMSFRKFTLWEEATKVPFIIYDGRDKKKHNGRKYTQAASLINVYRTIIDMAGLQAPEYVDGESLVPQLRDTKKQLQKPTITSWGKGNYSVRTENWRYIRYFDGTEELYNHESDEHEWHNLANKPEYKTQKEELVKCLPQNEAPTVEEYVAGWSVHGADKSSLKGKSVSGKKKKKKKK